MRPVRVASEVLVDSVRGLTRDVMPNRYFAMLGDAHLPHRQPQNLRTNPTVRIQPCGRTLRAAL